jgi:hypothetical protein
VGRPARRWLESLPKIEEVSMTLSRVRVRWIAAVGLAWVAGATAWSQSDIRTQRVQFKKGASSAIVEGRIKGRETIDYVVGARKGQSANVSLATKHAATYFNILAPGQTEVALFNGSVGQNQFEGVLPEDGDYKIRVYMIRAAARRNETANYRLEIVIGPGGSAAAASATDAKVAGTGYHATGDVPCSMGSGQPTGSCAFGVTRAGKGSGTVAVTRPDGRKRTIFFENSRATGYDLSQSDKGAFKATRQGDLTIVNIGQERYEIPDAVISGG